MPMPGELLQKAFPLFEENIDCNAVGRGKRLEGPVDHVVVYVTPASVKADRNGRFLGVKRSLDLTLDVSDGEPSEGLRLNLPDTLSRNIVGLGDRFQGFDFAVGIAVAPHEHVAFALVKDRQKRQDDFIERTLV